MVEPREGCTGLGGAPEAARLLSAGRMRTVRTVLVPTRDPAALGAAPLAARGTLGR